MPSFLTFLRTEAVVALCSRLLATGKHPWLFALFLVFLVAFGFAMTAMVMFAWKLLTLPWQTRSAKAKRACASIVREAQKSGDCASKVQTFTRFGRKTCACWVENPGWHGNIRRITFELDVRTGTLGIGAETQRGAFRLRYGHIAPYVGNDTPFELHRDFARHIFRKLRTNLLA